MVHSSILGSVVTAAAVARAMQPGALKPVAAPMRDLTWGQINFLHTTDTHGWLSGHMLEPSYSADWGDYISFSEHLRSLSDERGTDLLLVDTGDRIEGSGLYDGSTPKGLYQYDIYAQQNVDIICTGNHELYKAYSIDKEHNTTVPNFKENYIASNLDYIDPKTGKQVPQAQRYRKFKTKNQGIEIIAFGFLFDFVGNAKNGVVQKVKDTIKEEWFQTAIQEKPDMFVVIGHVGLRMQEFKDIFTAIRKENWDAPIAMFGGHAHVRDALSYGSGSLAMASGRYLETIGWMSVDGVKVKDPPKEISVAPKLQFTRKYIDNNLYGMYYHTGLNETTFPTEKGKRVSKMIEKARNALQLDDLYGCAPQDLWMTRSQYPGKDNIYTWLEEKVMPAVVVNETRKHIPRLALTNTGVLRFDIFKGPFTRDSTFTISPFTSTFNYIPDVPFNVAKQVLGHLNSQTKILDSQNTKFMSIPEQMFPANYITVSEEDEEQQRLELRSLQPKLTAGYTTKDDIGNDGDDTIHEPLSFHPIPNALESRIAFPAEGSPDPETVDLVFLDFIQPWVIRALKLSGGDFADEDVKVYMDGTVTEKMEEWIKENWHGQC